jgi:CelD/BcsL family acetyltransferase involved in cellulose biosynthesis
MKRLSEDGVQAYDHLTGFNRFKQDYAKSQRNLAHLTITKPTMRSTIHGAADFSRRAMRKAINVLRKPAKPATPPPPQESSDE